MKFCLQSLRKLDADKPMQRIVGDEQIGPAGSDSGKGFLSITVLAADVKVALFLEQVGISAAHQRMIVHKKDAFGEAHRRDASAIRHIIWYSLSGCSRAVFGIRDRVSHLVLVFTEWYTNNMLRTILPSCVS